MTDSVDRSTDQRICFVGFGEAGEALSGGFRSQSPVVWDQKLLSDEFGFRERIQSTGFKPASSLDEALEGIDWVVSLVTADQAAVVCEQVCSIARSKFTYLEMNSCSPGTKRSNAQMVADAGGVLADVAIMSPVNPSRLKTPLLVSGPSAEDCVSFLNHFGYNASLCGPDVGQASALKMTRSIMIKGVEALSAECFLTAQRLGIQPEIVASLTKSFDGLDWLTRGGYNLERMSKHGIRRAAEMREVVATIQETGLSADMTRSTVEWQQRIGDLALDPDTEDLAQLSRLLNERLS
jgi:3-hydroxyisobutyrate dehydrogenase-like beta-hydroxyacid dehydrogenase